MSVSGRLAALARVQHGLIERQQALALGVDDTSLARAWRTGELRRLHPSVYVVGGAPSSRLQVVLAGCLAGGDGTVVSHRTAAAMWGILDGDQPVELSVARGRQPRIAGAVVHRSTDLSSDQITRRSGVPVTTPARTLLDLGAVTPRWVVAEALERSLALRLLTPVQADGIVDRFGRKGRSGTGALRWALDERALGAGVPDGLLEPRMARLLRDAGLPEGAFQHEVRDRAGAFVARVDFAWPDRSLIVEVDGHAVHGTPAAMTEDLARQNRLVALGWTVLRFTWTHVVRRPAEVVATLRPLLGA